MGNLASAVTHDHPLSDAIGHPSSRPHFVTLHDFPDHEIEPLWRDFLSRAEFPAHYDTPEYFLEPYWTGQNPFAVLAFVGSKMVGVLTGLHKGGNVVCGLPSRPQVCIDPRADAGLVTDILAEGLLFEAGNAKLISIYSWDTMPLPAFERYGFWSRKVDAVVVLDLYAGAKALFDGFAKNRRRDVRIGIRNGIAVSEETTVDDLQEYWKVYSTWRKTERKKIQHNRSFASIEQIHNMPHNHRRFLARYQDRVIAASGVRFCPGGVIEFANNCSLDEYLKLLPNDFLVWHTIEWACQHGFKRYSFGGAHPFLRKWGGTAVPIRRYRLDRTLFRRHDLRDLVGANVRKLMSYVPSSLRDRIKKMLGKEKV